jgi:hypothetical protein
VGWGAPQKSIGEIPQQEIPAMADPLLLNLPQAAELLGLTPTQLYGLTRNRSRLRQTCPIPFFRLGKRLAFRRDSLVSRINEMEGKTR